MRIAGVAPLELRYVSERITTSERAVWWHLVHSLCVQPPPVPCLYRRPHRGPCTRTHQPPAPLLAFHVNGVRHVGGFLASGSFHSASGFQGPSRTPPRPSRAEYSSPGEGARLAHAPLRAWTRGLWSRVHDYFRASCGSFRGDFSWEKNRGLVGNICNRGTPWLFPAAAAPAHSLCFLQREQR